MDPKNLITCREWLRNRRPLIGGLFQHRAVRRLAEDLSLESIPLLVEALGTPDRRAGAEAENALRSLRAGEDRELIDVLCRLIMDDPDGPAAKICISAGQRPSNREELCLFLVITGQFDAYFREDTEFAGLHRAYEAADETTKIHVLDMIQSGDRRFEEFFTGPRELRQCTEKEILIFSEHALHNVNWQRLFNAFLELPLKYGVPLLEPLRISGWEPEDAELKSFYREILKAGSGMALPGQPPVKTEPSFDHWLEGDKSTQGEIVTGQDLFLHLKHLKRQAIEHVVENLTPEGIPLLAEALTSPDRYLSDLADNALRSLQGREDRECIDVLCRLAMDDPSGAAAQICIATGKRPSDPEESCLFLVVTGQLDAYFREDPQFQGLSLAYETADETIKAHVMDRVRSGDRRFEGFFSGPRELRRCTGKEISIFTEYALRHGNWPRLFKAFLELPLKFGVPLLEHFRTSGWEPEAPELKSLYKKILAQSSGEASPDQAPEASGSVLDRWLADGESSKWDRLSDQELLARLKEAPPPEGVAIVAALAKRGVTEEIAAAVQSSPHWLVRLAGYLTGIFPDPDSKAEQEEIFWVRALAGVDGIMEFLPVRATPADVEKLAAYPPEAFAGKPGAVRRVLRLLVDHHAEVGVHEPLLIQADETAAVVERAD